MEAVSRVKYVSTSWRKANQILDLVRKERVNKALALLAFTNKAAVPVVAKAIKSGLANLGKNIDPSNAYIKEAYVGQSQTMKRLRPGPMGRVSLYKKKSCHITIVLETR